MIRDLILFFLAVLSITQEIRMYYLDKKVDMLRQFLKSMPTEVRR